MGEHVATTTQQKYPGRATVRTAVQTILGFVVSLSVVVPLVLAAADETLGDLIPESARAAVWGIGAGTVAVSLFVARVMAIPAVDSWLRKLKLSSSPNA